MPTGRACSLVFVLAAYGVAGCTAIEGYPGAVSERCDNHQDDDFDGLVDFADPDCAVFGAACVPGDGVCDRATLVCAARGSGHACVPTCGPDHACPAGWLCTADACACTPCVERCNGSDDDCDGRIDESTCAVGEICASGTCSCAGHTVVVPSTLDLLFVIDDSGSMAPRLAALRASLPMAVLALTTGDIDGDGIQEAAPVTTLHVGVVTTDLGTGATLPGCTSMGDDGILGRGTGCPGTPVIFFEAFRDSPTTLTDNLTCSLGVGMHGCGFPQPLSAALLALSPSSATGWTADGYVAPTFHDGTNGHGLDENAAFLRPSSTLVVVIVTDADDCSASDVGIYDPGDPRYPGDLRLRCAMFADALDGVSRLVDELFALRRDPANVFVAAIAGIPSGTGAMPPADLLALPAMQIAIDPAQGSVAPACGSAADGTGADPARRLVEAADAIQCRGGRYALASICDPTYDAAFRDILRAVASSDDRRVCVNDAP